MQKESSVIKTKSLNEDHFPDNGRKIEQEIQEEFQSPADSNLPPAPRSPKWLSAILLPPLPLALPRVRSLPLFLSLYLFISFTGHIRIHHIFLFLAFIHFSRFHTFTRGTRAYIRSSSNVCSCV